MRRSVLTRVVQRARDVGFQSALRGGSSRMRKQVVSSSWIMTLARRSVDKKAYLFPLLSALALLLVLLDSHPALELLLRLLTLLLSVLIGPLVGVAN